MLKRKAILYENCLTKQTQSGFSDREIFQLLLLFIKKKKMFSFIDCLPVLFALGIVSPKAEKNMKSAQNKGKK